jgi:hypothetical protein
LAPVLQIAVAIAVAVEVVTVVVGLLYGRSGSDFARRYRLPLFMRIHHGVWGLVLALISPAFLGAALFPWVLGAGLGLFVSDAVHHLVVAPLLYGETRWHWP